MPACPLAETASTFGEMMLIDKLLAQESDEAVRRDLLFRQMDDAFATILRQNYFSMFEKEAHDLIAQGAQVSDLADAYLENLQSEFGDSVEINDEFRWEWVMIPHFTAFRSMCMPTPSASCWCFRSISNTRLRVMPSNRATWTSSPLAVPVAPVELLSKAGIDVTRAEFWQGGYDVIAEMVTALENLT
jgi:oligoendopeptidase F